MLNYLDQQSFYIVVYMYYLWIVLGHNILVILIYYNYHRIYQAYI